MRTFRAFLVAAVLAFTHLSAATIGFDDINASAGDVILGSYQGYTWTNFSAYTNVPGFPGFNSGIVSPANAAYSGGELLGNAVLGEITNPTSNFDFEGAQVGSGYYDNLSVTVQGFLGGMMDYTKTVIVGTTRPQLLSVTFADIDKLVFSAASTSSTTDPYTCGAVNCTQFTLDDVVLTPNSGMAPPPCDACPEPSTIAFLALGIFSLVSLRHFRRSAQ